MKKIVIFLIIILIIVAGVSYIYLNYKANYNEAKKENMLYEGYYNQEVYGADLATVINKAIDNNQKNEIKKDNKAKYIENETNSINIDIKMIDDDNIYNMEKIFNGGISTFTAYYNTIKFKCTKIDYHQKTGKLKYMLFEQITQ